MPHDKPSLLTATGTSVDRESRPRKKSSGPRKGLSVMDRITEMYSNVLGEKAQERQDQKKRINAFYRERGMKVPGQKEFVGPTGLGTDNPIDKIEAGLVDFGLDKLDSLSPAIATLAITVAFALSVKSKNTQLGRRTLQAGIKRFGAEKLAKILPGVTEKSLKAWAVLPAAKQAAGWTKFIVPVGGTVAAVQVGMEESGKREHERQTQETDRVEKRQREAIAADSEIARGLVADERKYQDEREDKQFEQDALNREMGIRERQIMSQDSQLATMSQYAAESNPSRYIKSNLPSLLQASALMLQGPTAFDELKSSDLPSGLEPR